MGPEFDGYAPSRRPDRVMVLLFGESVDPTAKSIAVWNSENGTPVRALSSMIFQSAWM
jgi:hypothetical protein